tara:strand:+ start:8364 stop:8582 length:219 start_codon:yes stop_codon:yes gene_type:complete
MIITMNVRANRELEIALNGNINRPLQDYGTQQWFNAVSAQFKTTDLWFDCTLEIERMLHCRKYHDYPRDWVW